MGGGASVAKKEEVPKYIQTIRKGQGSKLVKTLSLVESLSCANENKEYLCSSSLGLVSELSDILNKDAGEARDTSLKILFNLSSQPKNIPELMDSSHGLPVLLSSILSNAPGPTKITAFSFLLNVVSDQQTAAKLLNPLHGLIPAIIVVLAGGDKELSKYGVSLLGILFMAPGGASTLGPGASQLLGPLCGLLMHRSGSLQGKALTALRRLVETSTAETRVAASVPQLGLLNALLLIANDRNNEANNGKALQTMKFILSEHPSVANVAVPGNGIIAGIAKLASLDGTAADGMAALQAVLQCPLASCRTYLALADSGLGALISEILGNKTGPLDRKVWAIAALDALLTVKDNRTLLGTEKLSLIPLLVSYVRSRTPGLIESALPCLVVFASIESLIPQMVVPKYELLPTLANIICTDKGDLRNYSLSLLQGLSAVAAVREQICSYQLGLMQNLAPVLENITGAAVKMALSLILTISCGEEDQVWFSAPDLGVLPALVKIAASDGSRSPERKDERKLCLAIFRNISRTPANRQYMSTPKVGLVPLLIEVCKGGGKKVGVAAVETLANIAEDSGAVCEPFSNYEFYAFIFASIRENEAPPAEWAADSAAPICLTLLMHVCMWPQSHPSVLRVPDVLPTLSALAAGEHVQGMKAVLTLALLLGGSEDPGDQGIMEERKICLRAMKAVFIHQTRSSRSLAEMHSFPMKVAMRALWRLSMSDANKSIILASSKIVKDLCGSISAFAETPQSAKFVYDYEVAKRVAEYVLDVLLSVSMVFSSPAALLASDTFEDPEGLVKTLSALKATDLNSCAQQTAAMLSWRLRDVRVDDEEEVVRNFVAVIYSWPVSQTSSPELIECFALSLKSMNYNVVLVENGRCKSMPELSPWELPAEEAFPAAILARCSAAVVAVSSCLSSSPSSRLMVQTALELNRSDGLELEFINIESNFSLENSDKKLGLNCCSNWLRSAVGKKKVRSLWAIANVEPVSNKIGEAFDGIKELRGKAVPRRKKKPVQYSKKEPRGNERRYDVAWGILQVPNKAKKKDELASLIASIGVYNAMDLQLCDFDDLMCISKLLKKIQMRNFNELVFDIV